MDDADFPVPPDRIVYRDEPAAEPDALIEQALRRPIASPPLHRLAEGKRSAVILISDMTRLVPSHLFLPGLLDELNRGGLPDKRIRIVVALGMHRQQTEAELKRLVGDAVYGRVAVLNHSALPEDCVYLGSTRLGTPIEVNRIVAEAELRIATGNIEPHRLVGMSGGVKALIPGVASQRCIEANHALSQTYRSVPGEVGNPIRRDLEEALKMAPIHFLFNVVVNHRRELIEAVAGDVVEAHRHGVETAKRRFLVHVDRQYDLVIASTGGYPKDIQLYQAVKTLQNAASIAKPGGSIVLAAQCQEMFGNGIFQYWIETIRDRATIVRKLKERFVLGAHKIGHIDELLARHSVYLHSDMPDSAVELVGFIPAPDLRGTIRRLLAEGARDVAFMPYGALTFPMLPPDT